MPDEQTLLKRASELRRNPTEPEKRLWRHLSRSQLQGFKFRRQAVIGNYIADFLCPAKALVVEIDGDTHCSRRDEHRDRSLSRKGFTTLRFTNADVTGNMDGVLTSILSKLQELPDRWPDPFVRPHPNPSPEGEGL